MSSSSPLLPVSLISSIVGITFSALFSGGNFTNSLVGIPTLLLPSPSSPSQPPPRSEASYVTHREIPRPITTNFHLTRQWHHFFTRAKFAFPKLALIAGAGYGLAAYYCPPRSPARPYLWGAMATVLAIFPFTALIMPTNWRLMPIGMEAEKIAVTRAKEGKGIGGEGVEGDDERWRDTPDLIAKWGLLNCVRATIPLVAIAVAVLGLIA